MFGKLLLLFSAYAPLFLILGVSGDDAVQRWGFLALAALGLATVPVLLAAERRSAPASFTMSEVRLGGVEAAGFLATYVVPIVSWNTQGTRELIALVIFLAVVAVIYLHTSVILINPLLACLGWRVYEVRGTSSRPFVGYVLVRGRVNAGEPFLASRYSQDVLVVHPAH